MKAFKKNRLIFVGLLMSVLALSSCSPKILNEATTETSTTTEDSTVEVGLPIAYNVVFIDETPLDIQLEIDALITQRGYYKWTTDEGVNYLLISGGEKPTGGYGIEMVSFMNYEGAGRVVVSEGNPGNDAVSQVITYPYILIKYEGNLELSKVSNENTEDFTLLKRSTAETLSVTGIYQGQIDGTSIEVKVGDNYMAFRNMNFEALLVDIETGDMVEIEYITNNDGQNELNKIIQK